MFSVMTFLLEARATSSSDDQSQYGYIPTEWICLLFLVLFSVSTLTHTVQAVYGRLWWLLGTACVAGTLEIIGWSGRLWSSLNPSAQTPYLMQIVTTIIAPTFLIAANFVILGELIRRLGPHYSRLNGRWYTLIFCSCDFISLVIQAVGGAQAAGAVTISQGTQGGNVMLGGIVFQTISFTFYMILATEFVWRYSSNKPLRGAEIKNRDLDIFDTKTKFMILGLIISSVCIYIRSIYRLVELGDGWHGVVIKTEVLFNVFDAGMITIAMYTLNLLHPGRLLGSSRKWKVQDEVDQLDAASAFMSHGELLDAMNAKPQQLV